MGSTTIEKVHGCSQGACLKKWGKTGKTEKTHLCLDKSFVSVRLLYHVFSAHAVGPSIKMPPPSWLFAKGYFYCMWSGGGGAPGKSYTPFSCAVSISQARQGDFPAVAKASKYSTK